MIRSELCKIGAMNPSTFNVHRKNQDLPFEIETAEAKDGTGRTWGRFTLFHAAMMIAARQLTSQGVGWSEACRILRADPTHIGPIGHGSQFFARSGIFAARVTFANSETNEEPDRAPAERIYRGPLVDIVAFAHKTADNYSQGRSQKEPLIILTGIVAVDLSHCFLLAAARAEDLEIVATDDGRPNTSNEADE